MAILIHKNDTASYDVLCASVRSDIESNQKTWLKYFDRLFALTIEEQKPKDPNLVCEDNREVGSLLHLQGDREVSPRVYMIERILDNQEEGHLGFHLKTLFYDFSNCDLSAYDLSSCKLAGASFWGAKLPSDPAKFLPADKDLRNCNFNDCDLSAYDLSSCQLAGANFSGATLPSDFKKFLPADGDLRNCNFNDCDLSAYDLSSCQLAGASFWGAKLPSDPKKFLPADGDLRNCNLNDCDLRAYDLSACRLAGANFENVKLPSGLAKFLPADKDLRNCDFGGCDLSAYDLSSCQLAGASFWGAKLPSDPAKFLPADKDLRNCELGGRDLSAYDLSPCKLAGAKFSYATLPPPEKFLPADGDLRNCNFEGCDLYAYDLSSCNLRAAVGVDYSRPSLFFNTSVGDVNEIKSNCSSLCASTISLLSDISEEEGAQNPQYLQQLLSDFESLQGRDFTKIKKIPDNRRKRMIFLMEYVQAMWSFLSRMFGDSSGSEDIKKELGNKLLKNFLLGAEGNIKIPIGSRAAHIKAGFRESFADIADLVNFVVQYNYLLPEYIKDTQSFEDMGLASLNQYQRQVLQDKILEILGDKDLLAMHTLSRKWHKYNPDSKLRDFAPEGNWKSVFDNEALQSLSQEKESNPQALYAYCLQNADDMTRESKQLRHCIGNSTTYSDLAKQGEHHYLSIRDREANLLSTVELELKQGQVDPITDLDSLSLSPGTKIPISETDFYFEVLQNEGRSNDHKFENLLVRKIINGEIEVDLSDRGEIPSEKKHPPIQNMLGINPRETEFHDTHPVLSPQAFDLERNLPSAVIKTHLMLKGLTIATGDLELARSWKLPKMTFGHRADQFMLVGDEPCAEYFRWAG